MKNFIFLNPSSARGLFSLIAFLFVFFPGKAEEKELPSENQDRYFIQNTGQWDSQVKFLTRMNGLNCWITDDGIVYDLYSIKRNLPERKNKPIFFNNPEGIVKGHVIKMSYEGRSSNFSFQPQGKQQTYHSYFQGNNSSGWASGAPLYTEVSVKNIYPGIDGRYYYDNGLFRYDMIINPGTDLSQLVMTYSGQDGLEINENGELVLLTTLGDLDQKNIFAYQDIDGKRRQVSCSFTKDEKGHIAFLAADYDKKYPLVIDPLVFSTFIGGVDDEEIYGLAVDSFGNTYITGYTYSIDFPITEGAYESPYDREGGVFVTKHNDVANQQVFSAYIGGDLLDVATDIFIDQEDNIIISGYTWSTDYPTSVVNYQSVHGGYCDVFVTKLNSSGSLLLYSTFLGGSYGETWNEIQPLGANQIAIWGTTGSTDFPVTSGCYQPNLSGAGDGFLSVLDLSTSTLLYSTYIGGTNDEYSTGLALDNNGGIYLGGYTNSPDFPTSVESSQPAFNGIVDGFIVKFNSSPYSVAYSTYIGGAEWDWVEDIAVDLSGFAYLCVSTDSEDYPVTAGALQTVLIGDYCDLAITKMNPSGTDLVFSTFIGTENDDYSSDLSVDNNGNVYFAGCSESIDFPVTENAYQPVYGGGYYDIVIGSLDPTGADLQYATYFGGSGYEQAYEIIAPNSGNIYFAGLTGSADFPVTDYVYQPFYAGGNSDGFISKINYCTPPEVEVTLSPSPAVPGHAENTIYLGYGPQSVTLTASGGVTYAWSPATGLSCTDCSTAEASPYETTTYTVAVTNDCGSTTEESITVYVIDVRCGNNNNKVKVCHNSQTLCLPPAAATKLLDNGAMLGDCTKDLLIIADVPGEVTLESYPNPFNRSTIIEYSIPYESLVVAKVYDMLSREVATLVNNNLTAGVYRVEFDASQLAEGIYTCRLQAGNEALKMLMIRAR